MRSARSAGEKKVTLEMVYATGGIHTPRSILSENGVSIHKFSKLSNLSHRIVEKLLEGDEINVSEEQKKKFKAGLSKITSTKEQNKKLEINAV